MVKKLRKSKMKNTDIYHPVLSRKQEAQSRKLLKRSLKYPQIPPFEVHWFISHWFIGMA